MPTSSSDSEGTSQRTPRRRSTPRSETTPPATRSRRKSTDDAAETSAPSVVDDFGSGVAEEKATREVKPARRTRTATVAVEESNEAVEETKRERRPRREPRAKPIATTEPEEKTPNLLDRSSRSERTSNRLERQIADVESQTGMRYFSTDELDFGDDDDSSTPSPRRGRSRIDSSEDRPQDVRDDFDRDIISDDSPMEDGDFPGEAGEGRNHAEGGLEGDGGDRRPRRRRRRRRRGPDNVGSTDSGDTRGGDQNRSFEVNRDADQNRGSDQNRNFDANRGSDQSRGSDQNRGDFQNRGEGRNDGRDRSRDAGRNDSGRSQGSNRQDSGRGRRPSSSGGNTSGGNNSSRGRRNDGNQPRGGSSSRDSSRGGGSGGRDRGGVPRRNSRQVQTTFEVIEGTFDGVLELHNRGYGFLRDPKKNYVAEDSNPFVSSSLVEKYKLREGVLIRGDVGMGTRNQGPRLQEVELIDGYTPEEYANVKSFENLTAINPFEQIKLEVGARPLTMRVMDLLCPIGKGQRALLVAPPRTGKTMLLQDIANSVSINHPEIYLMVLLIDERPEEVTEMRRMVKGEVISSSLDSDVESHVRISQLIIERAKRLAEEGKDVFILLDSITRMARAFNKWSNTGRTATGGLDIRALDIPKKLFGQARRFDEGGSLTVCGTALIDTGSRMDEAIFQEFKGTGNMEMVLSRDLADRRIWPSIDISKSGTRREEKILDPDLLEGITMLRRSLVSMSPVEAMEQLTKTMEKFPTNTEFLKRIRAVL